MAYVHTFRVALCIGALVGLIALVAGTFDARERPFDKLPLRIAAGIVNATGVDDDRTSAGVITISRWTSALSGTR